MGSSLPRDGSYNNQLSCSQTTTIVQGGSANNLSVGSPGNNSPNGESQLGSSVGRMSERLSFATSQVLLPWAHLGYNAKIGVNPIPRYEQQRIEQEPKTTKSKTEWSKARQVQLKCQTAQTKKEKTMHAKQG